MIKTRLRNTRSGSVMALMAGTALATSIMASTATAQTKTPTDTQDNKATNSEDTRRLDTIVINSTSGVDVLQSGSFSGALAIDTPLTVSVIPLEVMNDQQVVQLYDALRNTAGVTPAQVSTAVYSNVSLRGISLENRSSFRLNGSLPVLNFLDATENKVRVEALKGASALFYGFTPPSGVINMTTARPTEDPHLALKVSGNSFGGSSTHVDVGGTSENGMFGIRANIVNGYVDSGIDYAHGSRSFYALAADFKPTDYLTFTLDYENIEKDISEPPVWLYQGDQLPPILDADYNWGQSWGLNHTTGENVLFHGDWEIAPSWNLTFDYGTSDVTRDRHLGAFYATDGVFTNPDGSAIPGLFRITDQTGRKYSNENSRIQLSGLFETGVITHQVLVGASRNVRKTNGSNSVRHNYTDYDFLNPPTLPVEPDQTSHTYKPQKIDDIGYYAFDRMSFGEQLDVIIGLRQFDYVEGGSSIPTFTDNSLSKSLAVVYKPRTWASVYASYIEGIESTPGAPTSVDNPDDSLGPQESKQYEAGLKIEPRKGVLFQAAYFDIERSAAIINADNLFVLDGTERYKGFELSLAGDVTDDLTVVASALFLDAKYEDSNQLSGDITGNRIDGSPESTISLSVDYNAPAVPGLGLHAGAYHVSDRPVNSQNQAFVSEHTTLDLGASYEVDLADHPTVFRINAENVTDEKYFASAGGGYIAQSPPAQVKFSISTEF